MDVDLGDSMFQCYRHPSAYGVGVCAACLKERLTGLREIENNHLIDGAFEFAYSSESESCIVEFDKSRLHSFVTESSAREKRRDDMRRTIFPCLPRTHRCDRKSVPLRSFVRKVRSFFHSLRRSKKQIKQQDTRTGEEDSFVSIKLDPNEKNGLGSSTLVDHDQASFCKGGEEGSSSSRSSASQVKHIISGPSWELNESKESTILKKECSEPYYSCESHEDSRLCNARQEQEEAETNSGWSESTSSKSTVRWRTRMNSLFQMKWKEEESFKGQKKISHVVRGYHENSKIHHSYPTSKVWTFKSLHNDSHFEQDDDWRCYSGLSAQGDTDPNWVRSFSMK